MPPGSRAKRASPTSRRLAQKQLRAVLERCVELRLATTETADAVWIACEDGERDFGRSARDWARRLPPAEVDRIAARLPRHSASPSPGGGSPGGGLRLTPAQDRTAAAAGAELAATPRARSPSLPLARVVRRHVAAERGDLALTAWDVRERTSITLTMMEPEEELWHGFVTNQPSRKGHFPRGCVQSARPAAAQAEPKPEARQPPSSSSSPSPQPATVAPARSSQTHAQPSPVRHSPIMKADAADVSSLTPEWWSPSALSSGASPSPSTPSKHTHRPKTRTPGSAGAAPVRHRRHQPSQPQPQPEPEPQVAQQPGTELAIVPHGTHRRLSPSTVVARIHQENTLRTSSPSSAVSLPLPRSPQTKLGHKPRNVQSVNTVRANASTWDPTSGAPPPLRQAAAPAATRGLHQRRPEETSGRSENAAANEAAPAAELKVHEAARAIQKELGLPAVGIKETLELAGRGHLKLQLDPKTCKVKSRIAEACEELGVETGWGRLRWRVVSNRPKASVREGPENDSPKTGVLPKGALITPTNRTTAATEAGAHMIHYEGTTAAKAPSSGWVKVATSKNKKLLERTDELASAIRTDPHDGPQASTLQQTEQTLKEQAKPETPPQQEQEQEQEQEQGQEQEQEQERGASTGSPLTRAAAVPAAAWSVAQVQRWAGEIGLPEDSAQSFAAAIAENEVDGAALLALTRAEVKEDLGVKKLGPLKHVLAGIEELKAPPARSCPPTAEASKCFPSSSHPSTESSRGCASSAGESVQG